MAAGVKSGDDVSYIARPDTSSSPVRRIWFTIRTHRHEDPGPGGVAKQLTDVEDLFDAAIQLVPVGEEIHVKVLKGLTLPAEHAHLVLDPTTMLVKDRAV